jgi:hypothetical protein
MLVFGTAAAVRAMRLQLTQQRFLRRCRHRVPGRDRRFFRDAV